MTSTQLTPAQQALAAEHYPRAAQRAREFGWLSFEERHSAACLGLCLAAAHWEQRGTFQAFADLLMRCSIIDDIGERKGRGRRRRYRLEIIDGEVLALFTRDRGRPFVEISDDRDEVNTIRGKCVLTSRQADVLNRWLDGWNWEEIGRQLGITGESAGIHGRRAVKRLRGAAG